MITVHVLYDPAVFYMQSEWDGRRTESTNVQATVESPLIHMIAAGSSSIEDQASLLQDRIDCLLTLSEPVTTSTGIRITDKIRFFVGDHPAQQFERGTQLGGKYKCGGCGVKDIMMDDLAHTLCLPWRNLQDLQNTALSGKWGKKPGELKPFDRLRIQPLKEELHARGYYDTDKLKNKLEDTLKDFLKGIQHVPTLLFFNPTGSLSDLNLSQYAVLDCEPLHDLKGHLINLCKEFPFLLQGETRKAAEDIITTTVSEKMTCADHRIVLIQLHLFIKEQDVSNSIRMLLETAVRISQILYLPEEKRTPRHVLQFYCCTWVHHELCKELFTHFHAGMTKERFFGSYLHAIVSHAPVQLEIVALSSVNTENQERIFSQARKTAIATSNRHPQNVVTSLTIRLQAKTELNKVSTAVRKSESRVSKASQHIPKYKGTKLDTSFIKKRLQSWNQNLRHISPFLALGRGVWWEEILGGYHFFDGDSDPNVSADGPHLLHFRSTTLKDVAARHSECWEKLIEDKITLPTPQVFLYTANGTPNGSVVFHQTSSSETDCAIQVLEEDSETDCAIQVLEEDSETDCAIQVLEDGHETDCAIQVLEDGRETDCAVQVLEDGRETDCAIQVLEDGSETNCAIQVQEFETQTESSPGEHNMESVITQPDADREPLTAQDSDTITLGLEPQETAKEQTEQFKTKHAACIGSVLGRVEKLIEFDHIRYQLKTSERKPAKAQRQRHDALLAELQCLIQSEKQTLMDQIKETEKAYFKTHNTIPTGEACPKRNELLKKYKYANKLLATWHIH